MTKGEAFPETFALLLQTFFCYSSNPYSLALSTISKLSISWRKD